MTKVILILLAGLIFEAIGVVNLSQGLKQFNGAGQPAVRFTGPDLLRLGKSVLTNRSLLLGVACQTVYFAVICYLLTQRNVSVVWPLSALSFVFTGMAAKLFLGEQISALRWTGIVLVVVGAGIVTWSEKLKEREATRRDVAVERGP